MNGIYIYIYILVFIKWPILAIQLLISYNKWIFSLCSGLDSTWIFAHCVHAKRSMFIPTFHKTLEILPKVVTFPNPARNLDDSQFINHPHDFLQNRNSGYPSFHRMWAIKRISLCHSFQKLSHSAYVSRGGLLLSSVNIS